MFILEGNAYNSLGKIKESKECFGKAMEIYQDILGEEHPEFASGSIQLAKNFTSMGELHKAKELADKAISLLVKKFGDKHLSLVDGHSVKYQVYTNLAEYDKAQAELDTIKDIYKNAKLWNEYNMIQIKHNEAYLKMLQDDYRNALNSFFESKDYIVKTVGERSKDLIGIYESIYLAYMEQGEYDKAKAYMEKSQSLANSIYGKDIPVALINNIGMGLFYDNRGEFKKAFEIYSHVERGLSEYFDKNNYLLLLYILILEIII